MPNRQPVVTILCADSNENQVLCRLVHNHENRYQTVVYGRLSDLKAALETSDCMAVILDLDTLPLDNRSIGRLAGAFPRIPFLGTSRRYHHPDLQDAIARHLFACLIKPVDPDELHFFLESIRKDRQEGNGHGPT